MNYCMKLEEFVRNMQLPIRPSEYENSLNNLLSISEEFALVEQTLPYVLLEDFRCWVISQEPSELLVAAVSSLLQGTEAQQIGFDGKSYFDTYSKLREGNKRDSLGLSHSVAQLLLSRSHFVYYGLKVERFSCSQIARIFGVLEESINVAHKAVSVVAKLFSLEPEISKGTLLQVVKRDQAFSKLHMADVSVQESCELAQQMSAGWAADSTLSSDLMSLVDSIYDSTQESMWPYLQMLHWACLPVEFFDHPPSYIYEFSPRGGMAKTLFSIYETVATGNPVLNNAKATAKLDVHWAQNRSGSDAHALVRILAYLESIPYVARRELCRILRAWLHRVIELYMGEKVLLPALETRTQVESLIGFMCSNASATRGVVEQRVVDALSVLAFSSEGWVSKGLGDSVNASNYSRRKLGDIEFVNIDQRRAIALEAHAGSVSAPYLNGHRRSLSRIVERRLLESWQDLDKPENWKVDVIFVAHSSDEDLVTSESMFGVAINYEYQEFGDLTERATQGVADELLLDVFNEYVIDALNRDVVPQWIRDIAKGILKG